MITIDYISLHPCNLSQSRGGQRKRRRWQGGGGRWEGKNRGREGRREDSRKKEWIFHRGVSIMLLFASHVLTNRCVVLIHYTS